MLDDEAGYFALDHARVGAASAQWQRAGGDSPRQPLAEWGIPARWPDMHVRDPYRCGIELYTAVHAARRTPRSNLRAKPWMFNGQVFLLATDRRRTYHERTAWAGATIAPLVVDEK